MDIQRLRNLTTGRLHTDIGHVYQDIQFLALTTGLFTHQIPNAMRALEPWLREKIADTRMWEDVYDPLHAGEVDLPPMTVQESNDFWKRYAAQPSPFGLMGSGV